jgi:hypothetical protein
VLTPGEAAPAGLAALIEAHEARVPLPQAVGEGSGLGITRIELDTAATPAKLAVEVQASGAPSLFVEGPPDWFLPLPHIASDATDTDGMVRFVMPLQGLPKGARLPGTVLTLTLVAPEGAIETRYTLP